MVMPLVHESRPKCYVCCEYFEDIDALKEHKAKAHSEAKDGAGMGAAPGDVSIF